MSKYESVLDVLLDQFERVTQTWLRCSPETGKEFDTRLRLGMIASLIEAEAAHHPDYDPPVDRKSLYQTGLSLFRKLPPEDPEVTMLKCLNHSHLKEIRRLREAPSSPELIALRRRVENLDESSALRLKELLDYAPISEACGWEEFLKYVREYKRPR